MKSQRVDLVGEATSCSKPAVDSSGPGDLSAKLTARNVHGYLVGGSCGLDGFILAEGADSRLRDRPAVFP